MSDRQESVTDSTGATRTCWRALRALLLTCLIFYFIAVGLFAGLRYLLLPYIDNFRPHIESFVSAKLHVQLRIDKLTPHWSGLEPGIDITGLSIRDRNGKLALNVPHATAVVSWSSLMPLKLTLSSLIVENPDVLIERAPDGALSVAGIQIPTTHTGNDTFSTWLLQQHTIVLRGGVLRWQDQQRQAPELAWHDIRAVILNRGTDHRVAFQAPSDGVVTTGPVDFRAHFRHARFTSPGKPQNWTGSVYLSTGLVDLPALARYINFPIATFAGHVTNEIWASFAAGRLRTASGYLRGDDIVLRAHPALPLLNVPSARFSWAANIDAGHDYTLRLADLRAELAQPPLADGTPVSRVLTLQRFTGRYRAPNLQQGQLLHFSGDYVDLGLLAEFCRALPIPQRFHNELVRFDPHGLVADYIIEVERAKPPSEQSAKEQRISGSAPVIRYRVKGTLQGMSLAAQEPPPGLSTKGHPRVGIPGFENLWGTVDADQTRGAFTLDTFNAAVTLPGAFDDPRLLFERLAGHGSWVINADRKVTVTVPEFNVTNADLTGRLKAHYMNAGHGRGTLDLQANIEHALVARIVRYLPTSLSEHLRVSLGHALQGGLVRDATIEVHGNLDTFPYSHDPQAGIFRISAPFSNGKFDPSPFPPQTLKTGEPNLWLPFNGLNGVFTLKENVLHFDIDRGHYQRVMLSKLTGHIGDLGNLDSKLVIDGNMRGPLEDFLDYANHSALNGLTHHIGERFRGSGSSTLALTLGIPRTHHPQKIDVKGTLRFLGNTLTEGNLPPLTQLTGEARFTEHSLELEHINARWLGGNWRANGQLAPNGSYAFKIAGHLAIEAARKLDLPPPTAQLLTHLSGNGPYTLSIRGAKGQLPKISASADMSNLALHFPAPFNKPLNTPMPVSFSFAPLPSKPGQHRATLALGPLDVAYELSGTSFATLAVTRGAISIGKPAALPQQGVTAFIEADTFDADSWRALYDQIHAPQESPAKPAPALQLLPDHLALRFNTLTLLRRQWKNVIANMSRAGHDWQADITSDQVVGHLLWEPTNTSGPGQIKAHFERFRVPNAAEQDFVNRVIATPNQHMPTLDLIVDDLHLHNRHVGQLEIKARNLDENGTPVWQLDKFALTNPFAKLSATANWRTSRHVAGSTRTVIDFKLDISDTGGLLQHFGLPRTIKGGSGSLAGKIGWRGEPIVIDYPTLNGHVAIDLRHGAILKVDPAVAKLLGVLSLQSLSRVLTLNFRDVIGEGLPFESASGTGQIKDGIGYTSDFKLRTAPARAQLQGTIDLAQETQNFKVEVTPTISAGSAVIAAAIVNPLLGLGALAANFALSESISHLFAQQYTITGSWAHPRIERIHTERSKMPEPVIRP